MKHDYEQQEHGILCAICFNGIDDPAHQTKPAQTAGEMVMESLTMAAELIETARQYFPKSMHNRDKFKLEQTYAAISKTLMTLHAL